MNSTCQFSPSPTLASPMCGFYHSPLPKSFTWEIKPEEAALCGLATSHHNPLWLFPSHTFLKQQPRGWFTFRNFLFNSRAVKRPGASCVALGEGSEDACCSVVQRGWARAECSICPRASSVSSPGPCLRAVACVCCQCSPTCGSGRSFRLPNLGGAAAAPCLGNALWGVFAHFHKISGFSLSPPVLRWRGAPREDGLGTFYDWLGPAPSGYAGKEEQGGRTVTEAGPALCLARAALGKFTGLLQPSESSSEVKAPPLLPYCQEDHTDSASTWPAVHVQ